MELRQLEYLVAVAEEANFTRAAERVHISQSGVSAQIRQLERELGVELIDRSGRVATLTQAGRSAIAHARSALASADAVRDAVNDIAALVRGRLSVGMLPACTVKPLFEALATFHQDYPGVEITLAEDSADRLVDAVRTGVIDLALVATALSRPDDVDGLTIASDRLVAIFPSGHPLARRGGCRLVDVCAHPIVCMPPGAGIRTALDLACAAQRIRPTISLVATAPTAITTLAERGLGVGILSESSIGATGPSLQRRVLKDADVTVVLSLIWRRNGDAALQAFVSHATRAFG
jgi:DNA-binding transcriptional LysR family regulator